MATDKPMAPEERVRTGEICDKVRPHSVVVRESGDHEWIVGCYRSPEFARSVANSLRRVIVEAHADGKRAGAAEENAACGALVTAIVMCDSCPDYEKLEGMAAAIAARREAT